MSRVFSNDGSRAAKSCRVTTYKYLFESEIHSKGQTFLTHGDIQVDGHRFIIAQFTNEVGRGSGAEPYAQAVMNYTHSTWLKAEQFPSFNFPCLIITVFGEDAPS